MQIGATVDKYSWRIAFGFGVFYLVGLFLFGLLFFVESPAEPFVKFKALPFYGPIPSGVLWFGALGGVLISFVGIHEHRHDWDPKFLSWHLARPFVGAAVAVVAVLIVMSGILAVGSSPIPGATQAGTPTATAVPPPPRLPLPPPPRPPQAAPLPHLGRRTPRTLLRAARTTRSTSWWHSSSAIGSGTSGT